MKKGVIGFLALTAAISIVVILVIIFNDNDNHCNICSPYGEQHECDINGMIESVGLIVGHNPGFFGTITREDNEDIFVSVPLDMPYVENLRVIPWSIVFAAQPSLEDAAYLADYGCCADCHMLYRALPLLESFYEQAKEAAAANEPIGSWRFD